MMANYFLSILQSIIDAGIINEKYLLLIIINHGERSVVKSIINLAE